MQNLTILNKKEIKKIINQIKEQYGISSLDLNYVFLKSRDNKIFITNRSIAKIDLEKLRINTIGLYFCAIENNEIRLSIEGSQVIGKLAAKNILELDEKQAKEWFRGENIIANKTLQGFIILKYKNDFIGSGKYKNNIIINYLPKERRINL